MIFSPSRMGRLNKRALIRQLQKVGVSSRAGLAKSLGMSQPTAGKIVDELLELKILEEVGLTSEVNEAGMVQPGRPRRQIQLNRSRSSFLGIQMGVAETCVAELPLGVTDVDEWHISFATSPASGDSAKDWARQLRKAKENLRTKIFSGVILSVPGVVDESAGRVIFSPNVHWSEAADLVALVRGIWDVPVVLVQEERALALGHQINCPECEDFLLVDFGDGVGGAVIVNGKPFANPLPISGELGHTPVLGNLRRCGCGAVGCVETLVSIRGLLESFAAAFPGKAKKWNVLKSHLEINGVEPWLAQSIDAAAVAIAGALNVLGLRHVVITGSLTELAPTVLQHLSAAVAKGSMWARFGRVTCVGAPRRRAAGLAAVGIDRLVVPEMEVGTVSRIVSAKPAKSRVRTQTPAKLPEYS
jgi:predicted NBD/HSP70 family sugar kinase